MELAGINIVTAYMDRMKALQAARKAAGGELSQSEESHRADEMDLLWKKMSVAEQEACERMLQGES